MRLAFIDIASGYGADRPDCEEAAGGTTAAACFLARALVKAGVSCTFFNKIRTVHTAYGIPSLPLESLVEGCKNTDYTAFIFCGRWVEWLVKLVRENSNAPLIAWMHESAFSPEFVPALEAFDGIAFVSEWQR